MPRPCIAHAVRTALLAGLALVTVTVTAALGHSDTDRFGKTTHFEHYCCDGKDCHSTEDEDLEELQDGSVRHLPTGKVFPKETHKPTSNSKQYVCIYNGQARCLYRRFGT